MNRVVKVFSALAILSLAAFSPKSSEVQSATAQLDSMMAASMNVMVVKDWGACYQLGHCGGGPLFYAAYSGSTPFTLPNSYQISYYNGGSCGIVVTSVYEIDPC